MTLNEVDGKFRTGACIVDSFSYLSYLLPSPSFLNLLCFFTIAGFSLLAQRLHPRGPLPFLSSLYLVVAVTAVDFFWALLILPARFEGGFETGDTSWRSGWDWVLAFLKVGLYMAVLVLFLRDLKLLHEGSDDQETDAAGTDDREGPSPDESRGDDASRAPTEGSS